MSIVRRKTDDQISIREHAFGGSGKMTGYKILNPDEMMQKGRLFNHCMLGKDDEVAWHVHSGDGEAYYILKGKATYSDNGAMTELLPGDMSMVYPGEGHSIRNDQDEPLEFIALILFE